MNKKRARKILLAHACCTLGNKNTCKECPWYNTEDCESTAFSSDVIEEAILTAKGFEIMNMKLNDIKITSAFAESVPSEKKMNECRWNWNNFHRQDRWIVVDQEGYLIDGYIQYLVLKENGIEETKVKVSARRKKRWHRKNTKDWTAPHYRTEPTTYVYGVHPNSNCTKEFVWRVPTSWKNWADGIQIGDTILCATRFGYSPVVVTKIEVLDKCPVDIPVKKVCNRKIRRNGMVVEV